MMHREVLVTGSPHFTLITAITVLLFSGSAWAQHDQHPPAPEEGWAWAFESSAFLTGNVQDRKFRDFRQVESQNWLMATGVRKLAGGSFSLHGMLSFEPFTLRDLGSSQVFQTGETFGGAPLIDYQHPHDLIMGLSAAYEHPLRTTTLILRGGLVDEPALGPTAFMHRATAMLHPTAPLAHHELDSTHITHGVITAGVRHGAWLIETSAFRGREPDEDRTDLDLGALDSYAFRVSWIGGDSRAQLSAGRLEEPHVTEPGDVTRITASVEHSAEIGGRAVGLTLAWGQNREAFAVENGWLTEATLELWRRGIGYLRGEIADKHILGAGGAHPPGQQHPHLISRVGALTVGYQHQLWRDPTHAVSVGADVTGYRVPAELDEAYGR
ncbi:MAG TPA: hypothetical protein VJ717_12510, partial [Gemmatimonadaceae bacterium]|nr:hypothetical protein [Gemmatimonadaceae bacterium]